MNRTASLTISVKTWHLVVMLVLLSLVVGGSVVYAQGAKRKPKTPIRTITAPELAPQAFFKPGASYYAAAWNNTLVDIGLTPVSVLSTTFNVPSKNKADLIVTFSGELGYLGTYESNGSCLGYFLLDNTTLIAPGESLLTSVDTTWGGTISNVAMQGYVNKVKQGAHTITFLLYADADTDANCFMYNRSLTVIANSVPPKNP